MGWDVKATLMAFTFLGIGSLVYLLYSKAKRDKTDEDYVDFSTAKSKILEIKIPKQCMGLIVGRGGSKIKDIEALTDTSTYFRDDFESTNNKVCVVRGTDEAVLAVERMIHEIIVNQPLIETFEMFVPFKACGRIIGRNGETIRSITRASSAKVVVQNCNQGWDNAECKIIIKGTQDQIECAKLLVEQKVEEENELRNKIQFSSANRSPRCKANFHNASPMDAAKVENESRWETLDPVGSDGMLEVYVSALKTPDKFWVQLVGPSTLALDKLNEEMNEYYSDVENRALHELDEAVEQQIVAAPFSEDSGWYRAMIMCISEDYYNIHQSKVTLQYVDYGDTSVVKLEDVFELKADFLKLKFQAIECKLAKIKANRKWSSRAVESFEELTYVGLWKKLSAKVHYYEDRSMTAYGSGSVIPCVELFDHGGPETKNLGEELMRMGYAVLDTESVSSDGDEVKDDYDME